MHSLEAPRSDENNSPLPPLSPPSPEVHNVLSLEDVKVHDRDCIDRYRTKTSRRHMH